MLAYLYCGLPVISNITIPELPHSANDKGGLSFTLELTHSQSKDIFHQTKWLNPNGEIVLTYCRQDDNHWLCFPWLADFRISLNTKKISCYPVPKIPEETVRHLLLDQVLPRCLAYQGKIMVHASAIQHKQGLLLFIGDSGTGKSTLAGNFHQAGNQVVSDDCVWVKEDQTSIMAVPSYGGLRLWEDSLDALFFADEDTSSMAHYSRKKRISLEGNDTNKVSNGIPVLAVIVIAPPEISSGSEVTLDRLSLREAFIAMMKQTFQLDLDDLERVRHHMQALGSIVPKLPAFRLSMPRDYDLLPIVRQKILETVL
jgi:hypothetical protein